MLGLSTGSVWPRRVLLEELRAGDGGSLAVAETVSVLDTLIVGSVAFITESVQHRRHGSDDESAVGDAGATTESAMDTRDCCRLAEVSACGVTLQLTSAANTVVTSVLVADPCVASSESAADVTTLSSRYPASSLCRSAAVGSISPAPSRSPVHGQSLRLIPQPIVLETSMRCRRVKRARSVF